MFSQHILTSPEVQEEEQSILRHILETPIKTNKEQFECLGLIGNYHLTPYPDSNSNVPNLIDLKSHIGYNRHILHNPYATSQKSNPTSPRNRLMYYLSLDESSVPDTLVWRYLKVDSKEIIISTPYSISGRCARRCSKKTEEKKKTTKMNCISQLIRYK